MNEIAELAAWLAEVWRREGVDGARDAFIRVCLSRGFTRTRARVLAAALRDRIDKARYYAVA